MATGRVRRHILYGEDCHVALSGREGGNEQGDRRQEPAVSLNHRRAHLVVRLVINASKRAGVVNERFGSSQDARVWFLDPRKCKGHREGGPLAFGALEGISLALTLRARRARPNRQFPGRAEPGASEAGVVGDTAARDRASGHALLPARHAHPRQTGGEQCEYARLRHASSTNKSFDALPLNHRAAQRQVQRLP